ncbi:hypothetical protein F5Y11DRAFT_330353 [Daldinia sp. FL1419]|nr:hypothetical protein F5Y11DRAFT_330353 [Daldinia sp. FL1419]
MDAQKQDLNEPPSEGFSVPPSLPGQSQPWMKWFKANDLDTDKTPTEDQAPTQCQGMTQAATNIG